ncbi:MAG TPA: hypothetical protein PLR12_04685 [Clostridia bacterium]|nr:hypothetical protein [Clostridia bacterium]
MIIYQKTGREYKGNLHLHTTGSDGRRSPEDAVRAYGEAGYDFLALTDHRKVTSLPGYTGPVTLLKGLELDENLALGECIHLVGVGVSDSIMPQVRQGMPSKEALNLIHAHGGLCYLAHPHWSMNTLATLRGLEGLDGAEIYNGFSGPPYNPLRAEATQLLDLAAMEGRFLPTIATDDTHYYEGELFSGFILAQADSSSERDIMAALRAGRYYASSGPRFESVSLEGDEVKVACSPVRHIIFHSNLPWNGGRVTTGEGVREGSYRLNRAWGERFVRVVLEDLEGRRAWLNPFLV